jgi:predicted small lipoprotein YifL
MSQYLQLALLVAALAIAGCGSRQPSQISDVEVAAAPDVGDVSHYLNCAAPPRRELSAQEACEAKAYKARCTAQDDCYVSCINSRDGAAVAGGCAHVCTHGLHAGTEPPEGLALCAASAPKSP